MPEIGAKSIADELKLGFAGLRSDLDALRTELASAVGEVATEIKSGKDVARRLREEAAHLRQATRELLGNEGPEGTGSP